MILTSRGEYNTDVKQTYTKLTKQIWMEILSDSVYCAFLA